MYDSDPADIEEVGWAQFVTDAWTQIFVGYESMTGIRTLGRRWSDLLQAGLDCSQEVADLLVRAEVIERADRDLISIHDPGRLLSAMDEVLADMGADLADMAEVPPADLDRLLVSHHDLRALLRASFLASDGPRSTESSATG